MHDMLNHQAYLQADSLDETPSQAPESAGNNLGNQLSVQSGLDALRKIYEGAVSMHYDAQKEVKLARIAGLPVEQRLKTVLRPQFLKLQDELDSLSRQLGL